MRRRRRPWGYVPRGQEHHLAGIRALADGYCSRCPEPILKEQRVVRSRNGWIHVGCASGADDE